MSYSLCLPCPIGYNRCLVDMPCDSRATCTDFISLEQMDEPLSCVCTAGYTGDGFTCAGKVFNYLTWKLTFVVSNSQFMF